MAGAITQSPVGMGYETVKAAIAAVKGESLPAIIDSGFACGTRPTWTRRKSRLCFTTDHAQGEQQTGRPL